MAELFTLIFFSKITPDINSQGSARAITGPWNHKRQNPGFYTGRHQASLRTHRERGKKKKENERQREHMLETILPPVKLLLSQVTCFKTMYSSNYSHLACNYSPH